jgi:hypothetical protein
VGYRHRRYLLFPAHGRLLYGKVGNDISVGAFQSLLSHCLEEFGRRLTGALPEFGVTNAFDMLDCIPKDKYLRLTS